MTVVFVSNYFNHHQRPLCDALWQQTDGNFCFIETRPMGRERMELGYRRDALPAYVKTAYESGRVKEECIALIGRADVVIAGSAPEAYLKKRIWDGKLTFRYSERPLKKGPEYMKYLPRLVRWHMRNPAGKPVYLLCAGGYVAGDYEKFGLFRGKCYRWGYFPETRQYPNEDALMAKKSPGSILWAGRLISWKHPEIAIEVAQKLKGQGYAFRLDIIGNGPMEEQLRQKIQTLDLGDRVRLLGAMPPEAVRDHMERSAVFLCTSDANEGWGAVVNEAMNSGCAVIVSREAGSAPYLLSHGKNGFIFALENPDALVRQIGDVLNDPGVCREVGTQAYRTIRDEWNADVAARRFLELARRLENGEKMPIVCDHGPCAREE